jgi:hypothetical protein
MAGMLPEQGGHLKEPPPLPCPTRSFEHVLLHVGLARWLLIFGRDADILATVCGSSRVRFNYGSRTVANHAQGREIFNLKEQFELLQVRPAPGFSQVIFSEKFSGKTGTRLLFGCGSFLFKIRSCCSLPVAGILFFIQFFAHGQRERFRLEWFADEFFSFDQQLVPPCDIACVAAGVDDFQFVFLFPELLAEFDAVEGFGMMTSVNSRSI